MTEPDYSDLVARQRAYFCSGVTRPIEWRETQLKALRKLIDDNRDELYAAIWQDLRRNRVDADLADVQFCINEADYALAHLKEWMKPERVSTPLVFEPGKVRVRHDPLGVVLIIGAWNFPYMLTLAPLVAAFAGGNTAVIKPSEIAVACSAALARLIPLYFDSQIAAVAEGAVPETTALLAQHWDLIFFTGSPPVGKIVHQAAAKFLTPCILELGGKNPTIVHSSANVRVAARRIAFGRYINSGQVCTGPDHVLVWPEVKDEFVRELEAAIRQYYGDDPQASPDYGRIINRKSHDRLMGLMGSGKIAVGGRSDADDLYIEPTVLVDVSPDSPIMQEEVFGPILPVFEIASVEAVIEWVTSRPRPLGLYVFTEDETVAERIFDGTESGDAAVNDCTVQPLIPELPFGGVGNSGMGKYHGRWGFEALTNARGVLYHSPKIDPGFKYPPYDEQTLIRSIAMKLGG